MDGALSQPPHLLPRRVVRTTQAGLDNKGISLSIRLPTGPAAQDERALAATPWCRLVVVSAFNPDLALHHELGHRPAGGAGWVRVRAGWGLPG